MAGRDGWPAVAVLAGSVHGFERDPLLEKVRAPLLLVVRGKRRRNRPRQRGLQGRVALC